MPILVMPGLSHYLPRRFLSKKCVKKKNTCEILKSIDKYIASNNDILPVVINKGRGCLLYDSNGKEYLDFISGYCAVSLGHGHPKICKAVADQIKRLTHTSRVTATKMLGEYGEYIAELFCYEKVLPLNTGNEACETAVKLARKWGYRNKGICTNQAKVLFVENNFWGRSIAAISASTDPQAYHQYGPFVPCFDTVPFNDSDALHFKMKDPNICAFMLEPIQGEAGIVIPDPCYMKQVRELCNLNKVLMIADEVQCGLGACGCMLCCDLYKVRPDILILGKALAAGVMPVSALLADSDIMCLMEKGTHGSTFSGNALGCKISVEVLKVLQEEKVIENAKSMGELLRGCLNELPKDIVSEVRGLGLLNAIILNGGINAWNVSIDMMNNGLLAESSGSNIIRLCPPLTINQREVMKAAKIIRRCIENSRGACNEGNMGGSAECNGQQKKLPKICVPKICRIPFEK